MKNKHNKVFVSLYETPSYPSGFEILLYPELDNIPDNTINEIFVTDLLDNFADPVIPSVLATLLNKVASKGLLHIQSLDLQQFALYIASRAIDYSNKRLLYDGRKNIQTMSMIENMITKNTNCHIMSKNYINGFEYYFKIEKQ